MIHACAMMILLPQLRACSDGLMNTFENLLAGIINMEGGKLE